MTHESSSPTPPDPNVGLEDVEVDAEGNVTIGAPTAIAIVEVPHEEEA